MTTPAKPPIKRDPKAKRLAILEAGLELFADRGYHGVNTADVAHAAGVAVGTLFRLFATKEALANQIYMHCDALYESHMHHELAALPTPRAQFALLWSSMTDFFRAAPTAFIFYELSAHKDYLDETAKLARQRHKARIYELIKLWQAKGAIRADSHELLRAIVIGSFGRLVRESLESPFRITGKMTTALEELCWTAIRRPDAELTSQ